MVEPITMPIAPSEGLRARGVWPTLRRRIAFWVPAAVLIVLAFMAIAPEWVGGVFGNGDPRSCDLGMSRAGSAPGHPFGFDVQGCDLYTNVIHGARNSLLVALLATAMGFFVALVVGTVSGLFDGWADSVLSRLTDVFLGFPFIIGAIILLISFGERTPFSVALVLALFTWPLMARLVRSSVRSVRRTEFVQASTAMGISLGRIVIRHVLPNALGPVLAIATINVGGIIVAESGLSFLGVGLDAPAISWGRQIADAQTQLSNAPHLILWPGLFLALTVLALISLGDVLRDALDPRQG